MIRTEILDDPAPALPVLRELRGALPEDVFHARLARARAAGYRIIAARDADDVVGALGFRIIDDICWGRTLFIDDLVATTARRGDGVGGALLHAARDVASDLGCDHIRLCSGLKRRDAHRFYETRGFQDLSKQFVLPLSGD